jgi:hypothetical protein
MRWRCEVPGQASRLDLSFYTLPRLHVLSLCRWCSCKSDPPTATHTCFLFSRPGKGFLVHVSWNLSRFSLASTRYGTRGRRSGLRAILEDEMTNNGICCLAPSAVLCLFMWWFLGRAAFGSGHVLDEMESKYDLFPFSFDSVAIIGVAAVDDCNCFPISSEP